MDKATRRRGRIREIVAERGYASIDELVQLFAVTPQTIRRDINSLAERGELKRYHGGAGLSSSVENAPYDRRSEEHTSELPSLMRISYAVFCLTIKHQDKTHTDKLSYLK